MMRYKYVREERKRLIWYEVPSMWVTNYQHTGPVITKLMLMDRNILWASKFFKDYRKIRTSDSLADIAMYSLSINSQYLSIHPKSHCQLIVDSIIRGILYICICIRNTAYFSLFANVQSFVLFVCLFVCLFTLVCQNG